MGIQEEHGYTDPKQVSSARKCGETFESIVQRRFSRRGLLKGAVVTSAGAAATASLHVQANNVGAAPLARPLGFQAIEPQPTDVDEIVLPDGYKYEVLLRWGDPLMPDAPEFDVDNQTPEAQAQQFGIDNDMIAFFPLPEGSDSSDHGILVVNHEYSSPDLMFRDYDFEAGPTQEQVDIELAAHGVTVVEIKREDGKWGYDKTSSYNRRITATTEVEITGPAAGHELLQTSEDSTGTKVSGTMNNCAGGWTPWGTYLTAEENFHQYFSNLDDVADDNPVKAIHERYGLPTGASDLQWNKYYDRFDLGKEPNEPNRYGWVVEIDPYTPDSTPKKRTALGRFRHEAATTVVAPDDRVVCYTGDDARFEYVYKFITDGTFDPNDREANMDLLDSGTLYVAKFNDDGSGEWMPLIQGEGPLTADNGFETQADVLIKTRLAADLLEATPMDRPEDVETNPVNKKVYIMLTNNTKREPSDENAANPRPENATGHVIELTENGDDHSALKFEWEILLLCGKPDADDTYFAGYDKTKVSPIACPDNCTFDNAGNLWIATDGQGKDSTIASNDALHMVPVEGDERGHVQQFFSSVAGSETCGPLFTPDNTTLFIAVQHPGEGGTFDDPVSTWPDGKAPARASVIVIQAEDGGPIGGATEGAAETSSEAAPTPLPVSGAGDQVPLWVGAAGVAAAAFGAFLRRRSMLQDAE